MTSSSSLTLDDLLVLFNDIEAESPIDFGDLPFDEEQLRRLVLLSLIEQHVATRNSGMDDSTMVLIYMLSTARLVLENLVLQARLLTLQGKPVDVSDLLRKLRKDE